MTDITIPPQAVEAAARALAKQRLDYDVWDTALDRSMKHFYMRQATAALRAGLAAWPGMSQIAENDSASVREMACLILPLTQEPDNAEA